MVSGTHSKTYDINTIHEFIDNLPLPLERNTPTHLETPHIVQQQKLLDEPASPGKTIAPPPVPRTDDAPFVSPPPFLTTGPPKVEQPVPEKPSAGTDPPKASPDTKEPTLPSTPPQQPTQHLPPMEPPASEARGAETITHDVALQENLPEFEPVDEAPTPTPQAQRSRQGYSPRRLATIWDKNERANDTPSGPASSTEQPPEEMNPDRPTEAPGTELTALSPREARRQQRLLQKELNKKLKQEQQATQRQARETRRQQKQELKQRQHESLPTHKEANRWQRQNQILKHAREEERLKKRQEKLIKKNDLISTGLREDAWKRKQREDKQLKRQRDREKKHDNAYLINRNTLQPAREPAPAAAPERLTHEEEQQLAKETEERRTLKDIEHDLQKEKENKEKEARKAKAIEEEQAKKIMQARYEEERRTQQHAMSDSPLDIFEGFDSIDQATALTLYNHGYTTVDRLLTATIEDLMKIGIKKKIAHLICVETKEFVEWKVFDATDRPEAVPSAAHQGQETP